MRRQPAAFEAVVADEDGLHLGVAHLGAGGLGRLHLEAERGSGVVAVVGADAGRGRVVDLGNVGEELAAPLAECVASLVDGELP